MIGVGPGKRNVKLDKVQDSAASPAKERHAAGSTDHRAPESLRKSEEGIPYDILKFRSTHQS